MMRSERPRIRDEAILEESRPRLAPPPTVELFLAEPTSLHGHAYAISGWPNWLIPTYHIKSHRNVGETLEDER